MRKFKNCEAVVFEPAWAKNKKVHPKHPLRYGQIVYFLGEIPNAPGHCIVVTSEGKVVPMIHPEDCRKATDDEV